jgi:hypothetical protein
MLFLISLCCTFIFKTGVSPKSLWIRRGIVIAISCITSVLMALLFGIINIQEILLYSVSVVIGTTILSIIAYFIGDKIEKRNLQMINNKLKEMNTLTLKQN